MNVELERVKKKTECFELGVIYWFSVKYANIVYMLENYYGQSQILNSPQNGKSYWITSIEWAIEINTKQTNA